MARRDPWEGLEELIEDLGRFDREMVLKVTPEPLKETAREIRDQARRDTPRRTGKSAKSITVGRFKVAGQVASVDVGSDWFVMIFVEYGTPTNAALRPIGRAVEERFPELEKRLLTAMGRHAEQNGL